jgi:hypothetical protein
MGSGSSQPHMERTQSLGLPRPGRARSPSRTSHFRSRSSTCPLGSQCERRARRSQQRSRPRKRCTLRHSPAQKVPGLHSEQLALPACPAHLPAGQLTRLVAESSSAYRAHRTSWRAWTPAKRAASGSRAQPACLRTEQSTASSNPSQSGGAHSARGKTTEEGAASVLRQRTLAPRLRRRGGRWPCVQCADGRASRRSRGWLRSLRAGRRVRSADLSQSFSTSGPLATARTWLISDT